jgi:hypothetical protein
VIPSVKCVAIVSFEQDVKNAKLFSGLGHPVPRVVQYQVTIDPENVSPTGESIRFGGQGDEIMGWVRIADIHFVELLAQWDGEKFMTVQHSAERAA